MTAWKQAGPHVWVRGALPMIGFGIGSLALFAWWTMHDGGYAATDWYPGLLFLAVLLGLTASVAVGRCVDRNVRLALLTFGGYVGWSYLSIVWAASRGDALEGSDRALLALVSFWLFCRLRGSRRAADAFACAWVLTVIAIAAVLVGSIALGATPAKYFLDARLAVPLANPDADAGLFMGAALSAVFIASRTNGPLTLRAILVAGSGLLVTCCVLTGSRGWLYTLPVILGAAFLICRRRARLLAFLIPPTVTAVCLLPWLTRVYRTNLVAAPAHVVGERAAHAAGLIAWSSLALGIFAVLGIAAGERMAARSRGWRIDRRHAVAVAIAGVVAIAVLVAAKSARLEIGGVFKQPASSQLQPGHDASRFIQLGSARYDIWRVALQQAARNPLLGLGQDNFAAAYLQERQVVAEPRWVHSLVLRLLAHTGLPGLALFAAFIVFAIRGVVRGRFRTRGRDSAGPALVSTVALLQLAVWIIAGSVDWFWEYPAMTVPVMALLGLACSSAGSDTGQEGDRRPARPRRRAISRGLALLGLGAVATIAVAPYLAARDLSSAEANAADHPAEALSELRQAAKLNPLTERLPLESALIEVTVGDRGGALAQLNNSLGKDEIDWLAHFERGLLEPPRSLAARNDLERARQLNPREPLTQRALLQLRGPVPLTAEAANAELAARQAPSSDG